MKYVIWGTSSYYRDKIDYLDEKEIVAIVERNKITFCNKETILPNELKYYEYDFIIIMSRSVVEIAMEIIAMGIKPAKILLAINFKPVFPSEIEYIGKGITVGICDEGFPVWNFPDDSREIVKVKEDMKKIREKICSKQNASLISELDTKPVGKLFGSNRGGSIVRYYIEQFIKKNQSKITGHVLEIGDRNYTRKYGRNVYGKGYVLHFNGDIEEDEFDFKGDLCNGKGIRKNFYDCIILTQVLMYLKDIHRVPKILIDALKDGGTILISAAGIANRSRLDVDRYEYYWNYTKASIEIMFNRENTQCTVYTVGNCKTVCAFLQGMSYMELSEKDLKDCDEDYPLLVFAEIKKQK